MLKITIPEREIWNEKTEKFERIKECTLQLEHSLVSLSKWESKWHKPFLNNKKPTAEEILDYIKCMTITQNVNEKAYEYLTEENIKEIVNYIDDPMTATSISEEKKGGRGRIITSELIYYWMTAYNINIPVCQKWHLNRLLTLIRVCNIKNTPPKKMSRSEIINRNAALNAARRKKLNSKG